MRERALVSLARAVVRAIDRVAALDLVAARPRRTCALVGAPEAVSFLQVSRVRGALDPAFVVVVAVGVHDPPVELEGPVRTHVQAVVLREGRADARRGGPALLVDVRDHPVSESVLLTLDARFVENFLVFFELDSITSADAYLGGAGVFGHVLRRCGHVRHYVGVQDDLVVNMSRVGVHDIVDEVALGHGW